MTGLIFHSSIGRKAVIAVTGLILLGFVVVHMLGNLQIFLGPEWLNAYGEHLVELPLLLWPARLILLTAVSLHLFFALSLAHENKKARPVPYLKKSSVQVSHASLSMVLSGILLFSFIIFHLFHFTFGAVQPQSAHLLDAEGRHDVYAMVVLGFQNPWIAAIYAISMIALGMHLSHGAGSFLQSLGLTNPSVLKKVNLGGRILGWLLALGNTAIPLAVQLGWVKLPGGLL